MSTAAIPLPAPSTGISRTFGIFISESRYEFIRALRTKAYSLSVIGFPLVFYIFFGLIMNRGQMYHGMLVAKNMLAGYAVFGTIGAALFGIGVGLSGELSAGWLELKRASPMPPSAYLLAKCATAMAFTAIIVSLLCVLGVSFGGVHLSAAEYAKILGLVLAGSVPFASMGLLLALLAPFNAAPGIANMIYLPMSFLGGLWLPIEMLPKVLQSFAPALPTYHLKQLMMAAFGSPSAGKPLNHWLYLAGFTLLMLAIAFRVFLRREQNS